MSQAVHTDFTPLVNFHVLLVEVDNSLSPPVQVNCASDSCMPMVLGVGRRSAVDMKPHQSRHGVNRRGTSKEGAKVYLMGANGIQYLQVTRTPGSSIGRGLIVSARVRRTYLQNTCVDGSHRRGGDERARGRLDMLAGAQGGRNEGSKEGRKERRKKRRKKRRKEPNVASTHRSTSRDWRGLLFRPHLMRLAYDQDSSHW